MVPRMLVADISLSSTGATQLMTPTPSPDTHRPTYKHSIVVLASSAVARTHDKTPPITMSTQFAMSVFLRPNKSEGTLDNTEPIHPPTTRKALHKDTCASTLAKQNKTMKLIRNEPKYACCNLDSAHVNIIIKGSRRTQTVRMNTVTGFVCMANG
jgi:hypothetical protein